MSQLVALAVSIGLLGGVATVIYLKAGLAIWAGFIAWACFFHSGGDNNALKQTIIGNIFGAVWAWLAAIIILSVALADTLTLPVWAGIVVGLTVLGVCLAAHIKAFSNIPASVYGYAAIFAFLLQTPQAMAMEPLMAPNFSNALVMIVVSMALGAVFGWISGKLAGKLTKQA
ncbi:MAG: DUF1097 domain-containing protein [Gemmatimonadota bacterium]